jgi:hypothetical protein
LSSSRRLAEIFNQRFQFGAVSQPTGLRSGSRRTGLVFGRHASVLPTPPTAGHNGRLALISRIVRPGNYMFCGQSFWSSLRVWSLGLYEAGLAPRFIDVQNRDDGQNADANGWVDDVSS